MNMLTMRESDCGEQVHWAMLGPLDYGAHLSGPLDLSSCWDLELP